MSLFKFDVDCLSVIIYPAPQLPIMHFSRQAATKNVLKRVAIPLDFRNNRLWFNLKQHRNLFLNNFNVIFETLIEEYVVVGQAVTCSGAMVKRASAVLSTGGVVITTPPAESPSRDFGSTIFITGTASDH